MSFDWLRFLDSNQIEHSKHGASGNRIAVHCPLCGASDEGTHMIISLDGQGWRCFRRPDEHKGKSAARLVAALIGCSLEHAARITNEQLSIPEDFMSRVEAMLKPAPIKKREPLRMPDEFRRFCNKPSCWPYLRYLERRGFEDVLWWADYFDLRYCTRGFFRYRVLFPVTHNHKLVSWTGRSLDANAEVRYLSLTDDPELAASRGLQPAHGPISDYLLWYDQCQAADADTIYLVEGPMDALKLWMIGLDIGVVATCVFTATASVSQIDKLHSLLPKFKYKMLMLDRGTLPVALRLQSNLVGLDVAIKALPKKFKDPGVLPNTREIKRFLRRAE